MTLKHQKVAVALIEAGGLKFDSEQPFILASRKIGPVYVDIRQLTASPDGWRAAISELVLTVRGLEKADVVSGGELADLFFSIPVAMELAKPHLAVRKAPKGYGAGGRLVGKVRPGERVVHVSDLITSGTSALDWVGAVREAGGVVEDYVVVFDRNQGGREALREAGVELRSLLRLDDEFLSFATAHGGLPGEQAETVRRYLADSEGWSREFLRRRPAFLTERIEAAGGKLTRSEGIEVLTTGYPELIPEIGGVLRKRLHDIGVEDRLPSLAE